MTKEKQDNKRRKSYVNRLDQKNTMFPFKYYAMKKMPGKIV